MKRTLIALGAAVLLAIPAVPAAAGPLNELFGCSEAPSSRCVVQNSEGGFVYQFVEAAYQAHALEIFVVFRGECTSACTLFADLVKKRACITKNVAFGFHKFSIWSEDDLNAQGFPRRGTKPLVVHDPPYSRELNRLLRRYGEVPSGDPYYLGVAQLATIWQPCS